MSRYLLIIIVILCYPIQVSGESTISFLLNPGSAKSDFPISINPDSYTFGLSMSGNKWNNKAGGELCILQVKIEEVNAGLSIGAFINVHDFSNQTLSWQLWRGNMGASTFFEYMPLRKIIGDFRHLLISLAWIHESQHATSVYEYTREFTYMSPYNFPNGSIRSFEFYQVQINYYSEKMHSGNWLLDISGGLKYFPEPQLEHSNRLFLNSFYSEVGVHRKVSDDIYGYLRFYYESIQNNFVAAEMNYRGDRDKQPLQYRIVETGITFNGKENKTLSPFISWIYSNGRGLDFPSVYEEFGFGIRISL